MPFYAVAKGRTPGIFMTWPDCEAQVKGFPGARYKKFDTTQAAQDFIGTEGGNVMAPKPSYINKNKPANTSSNNLKRPYSTTTSNYQRKSVSNNKMKSKPKSESEDYSDSGTDDSDDLNTMLNKQMDDIEKRLKGFEKGVDKIIKKGAKGSGRQAIMIDPPQPKKGRISGNNEFDKDDEGFVKVYTDGACSANGRSGARAGLGVYWGEGHPLNISEPVSGRATNNCGEIQAATKAIKQAIHNGVSKLAINTDSQFLINSVTKWMPGNVVII